MPRHLQSHLSRGRCLLYSHLSKMGGNVYSQQGSPGNAVPYCVGRIITFLTPYVQDQISKCSGVLAPFLLRAYVHKFTGRRTRAGLNRVLS